MKDETLRSDIFKDVAKSQKILDSLVDFNKGPELPSNKISVSKTCVVMDATGSMGGTIQKTKETVCTMFQRITDILKSKNIEPSCFQMQFCTYRNWSEQENEILQHSGWESRSDVLLDFMNTCIASGGYDPGEAVEVGLWHANRQAGLSQVILLGDCASNTASETIQHRNSLRGDNYWRSTKFATPFTIDQEVQKLKTKGVPVHAFYVYNGSTVQASFGKIASETTGQCRFLDVNSSQGAAMLTEIVACEVLKNAGNQNGGAEMGKMLVDEYAKKFGTSFK